jgi:hypothetical protein
MTKRVEETVDEAIIIAEYQHDDAYINLTFTEDCEGGKHSIHITPIQSLAMIKVLQEVLK